MSSPQYDLAIIGAGPAGMAAAHEARNVGLSVVVIDEQDNPGGQIYRDVEHVALKRAHDLDVLGADYKYGYGLVDGMRAGEVDYLSGHTVWQIEADGIVWCTDGSKQNRLLQSVFCLRPAPWSVRFPCRAGPFPG